MIPDQSHGPARSGSQLGGSALALARAAWFMVFGLGITLAVLSLRPQFARWQTVCSGSACGNLQLTLQQAQELSRLGISLSSYSAYFMALDILVTFVFVLIAGVIFWRKSDDRMALFVSIMLIAFGIGGSSGVIGEAYPILQLPTLVFRVLGNVCIVLFFFLFPDGRFVPGWARWVALLFIAREVLFAFLPNNDLISILLFGEVPIGVLILVYRYRRVSTVVQRQQTKWVIFGVAMGISGDTGAILLTILTGAQPGNATSGIGYLVGGTALYLFIVLIPISIGMAILRSHLWDIDILIRRTLIYSALTGLLALVYLGVVVALQAVFTALTGQPRSELVTVISTLVIAALFVPLRRRVQTIIDHRFYRRKYDAARTLAAFGAALRDEVNLDDLAAHLLTTVEETMQPESVSLWLVKR